MDFMFTLQYPPRCGSSTSVALKVKGYAPLFCGGSELVALV